MAKPKKSRLTKKESETILPTLRDFNKIASAFNDLMGKRVESKEKKISVMVSRIKTPGTSSGNIRVQSVAFSKDFLKNQRKKRKKSGQSDWDEGFSERRGFVI